jgi:hypothetical protein
MHPRDEVALGKGEVATMQLEFTDYQKLRAHTGESKAGMTGDRLLAAS